MGREEGGSIVWWWGGGGGREEGEGEKAGAETRTKYE